MRILTGLFAALMLLAAAPAVPVLPQEQDDDDEWPHEIVTNTHKLILYQPQLDSLEGDTIVGRCAASVAKHNSKDPIFGTIWIKARMVTDRGTREVTFTDIDITNVKFPKGNEEGEEKIEKFLEGEIPKWGLKTSMERITAAQELLEKEQVAADKLKNDPPQILKRTKPTVLLVFDGEPILAALKGTALKRVVNCAMFLVQDDGTKKNFLNLGDRWAESPDLVKGPWTKCAAPPPAVAQAFSQDKAAQEQEKAAKESKMPAEFPDVVAVTKPAELIVVDGEDKWASIAGTGLHYIDNTDSEVFRETASGKLFVLAAGRWFTAASFDGPWTYVASDALPADFQKIPPGHEVADVRASVAGTDEAKEALLDAKVPQTAAIKRSDAKVEVTYDGEPTFEKVEGLDIRYAVNTAFAVFLVKGKYYCCHNAAWFEAPTAKGPWQVCTKVPEEIYALPPSCPHYNVKYVYVYDSTPEYVYCGYTSGYCGSYIYGPTVVYGTGWWYAGWWGAWYYPRPCTWGVGVRYNCVTGNWGVGIYVGNPWYGCAFGWTARWGGWVAVGIGGCVGWWGGGWHGDIDINNININRNGNRVNHHNNNIYNRRNDVSNRMEARPKGSERPRVSDRKATGERNNVLSDRDGNVYRNDSKEGWQKRDSASRNWSKSEAPRPQQKQMERNQQSRQRSVQKQQQRQNYNRGGGSARRGGGGGGRGGGGRR